MSQQVIISVLPDIRSYWATLYSPHCTEFPLSDEVDTEMLLIPLLHCRVALLLPRRYLDLNQGW